MKLQNKDKILCIIQLPPPIHGNAMMNQYLIESKSINNNFLIKILSLKFVKQLADIGNFQIIKLIKMIIFIFKLLFQLIKFNPDLIYYTISPLGFAFYRDVLFVSIIKLFNKKIIYHLHAKGIKQKSRNKLNFLLYKFIFKDSYVIHLSPLLYNDIKNFCPLERVYFCPNGIPYIVKINKTKDKKCKKIQHILFFSNMIKTKGVMVLLEACKILKNKNINFQCNFVGEWFSDVQPEEFQDYIDENDLNSYIKYICPKYNIKEKVNLFNNSDILAFPTYNDCFPIVVLEAMKFGLPVVSTYEGAIPEIVINGKTGFLVPQKDSYALADKLKVLIENPKLREKMGKAGREKFLKHYTLDKWEKKMVNIFNKILGKN